MGPSKISDFDQKNNVILQQKFWIFFRNKVSDEPFILTFRPALPYDLEDASAVAIGESIYLFGGWMYVGATNKVLFLS